eukprot:c18782_g1_i1.p1 GENE.c18782_g1_i1~~c18782_g1_i1.p1  ORF type:complete len:431 (+),score=153.03 c18782_g1_i1:1-1293(+)
MGARKKTKKEKEKEQIIMEETSKKSVVYSSEQIKQPLLSDYVEAPPEDRYHLAYIIMTLLGSGGLLPWNACITAFDYFTHFYPDLNFGFTCPFVYNIPNFIFCIGMVFWGNKLSLPFRFLSTFSVFSLVMQLLSLTVIAETEHESWSNMALLCAIGVLGMTSAVAGSTIFSLSAQLPPLYTQAVMSGQGISGIIVVIIRLVTKASFKSDDAGLRQSSLIYFEIGVANVLLCIVGYLILVKLPIYKYYTQVKAEKTDSSDDNQDSFFSTALIVVKEIWVFGAGVFFVFFITLGCFPGLTGSLESTLGLGDWYPLIATGVFMVGDMLGRGGVKFFIVSTEKYVMIGVYSRVLFYLFFLAPHVIGVTYPDALAWAVGLLMSVSNGYYGSILMMFGPSKVVPSLRPVAGTLMALFLTTGIVMGSVLSFLVSLAL